MTDHLRPAITRRTSSALQPLGPLLVAELEGRQRQYRAQGYNGTADKLADMASSEGVAQMPNSAFETECRVPKNAERCRLDVDLASFPDRALGIISGALQLV
jgi:hypothetical protein